VRHHSETGAWTFGPVAGLVVVVLAVIGAFAVCNETEEEATGSVPLELAHHYDDWDDDGSDGNTGYAGGGGRSGDYDGGPGDDCRNLCGNTIIVPTPGDRGGERRDRNL
jgi:hypothetical protein